MHLLIYIADNFEKYALVQFRVIEAIMHLISTVKSYI